jgi:small subunit ribosomal protein S8
MTDHLTDALNTLKTHEMVGQMECTVKGSRIVNEVLKLLKEHRYIRDYSAIEAGRGGYFNVVLDGRINNCGTIKPRFPVKKNEWAAKEQQYIPGVGVGLLVVSTPEGVMTNTDAQKRKIGGRLIAYIY